MSFNFVIPEINIGGAGTPPLQFFRKGFNLNGSGLAPSWQDIVLSGNGSLTLTNAKANGLNYVKLFGACEQDGSPYPDRPADISCNNGTLKFRYSNGLPLGYAPLEHVSYLGTTLSLGIAGFDDDTSEIYVEWKTDSTSVASDYQGVFTVWSANTYNSWRMLTYLKQTDKYYCYGNSRSPVTVSNVELDTWHTIECKSGKFKIDNNTYNTTVTSSLTPSDITLKIGGSSYLNNYYKYVKVKRQGEWIGIFLPAKRLSDNKIGLYDIVNDSFKTSTNFTAGREINVPIEIYTDGTVETIVVKTSNMLDRAGDTIGAYIDANGTIVTGASSHLCYSGAIPVTAGEKYTTSLISGSASYKRIHVYNGDTWVSQLANRYVANGSSWTQTITIPSDCDNIRLSFSSNDTNVQFEEGTTATEYEPYFNGGTATAENLLGVDRITDVQEVLTGAVTRNIGVLVLDGAERWSNSEETGVWVCSYDVFGSGGDVLTTHYQGVSASQKITKMSDFTAKLDDRQSGLLYIKDTTYNDIRDFQTFLTSQFNAGTPVVVVFPLATPTTETVTGQHLTTQSGTNIVEITQASINNLPLEVSYKGTV